MGSTPIRIPTSCNAFIEVIADVVTAFIPFLLGLDTLRKFGINVCLSTDQLKCTNHKWNVNTEQRHGHLYISESNLLSVLHTKSELIKLQRAFFHPRLASFTTYKSGRNHGSI
jgi:hypothetical protein